MNRLLTLLLILVIAAPAFGATVTATRNGAWNNVATWDTGTIPAVGDWANINSGVSVSMSGTVEADSLFINGNLTTAGDVQCKIGYMRLGTFSNLVVDVGDSLIQDAPGKAINIASDLDGTLRRVWIYAGPFSTVRINGALAAEYSAASAFATSVLFYGGIFTDVIVAGDLSGSTTVTSMEASTAPQQRIVVERDFPEATHVQLTNGWHAGAVYEIDSRPAANTLLLKRGFVGDFTSGARAVGADSVSVVQGALTLERVMGSVALFGEGAGTWTAGGRRVNNAFDNGDSLALYFDDENALTASMAEAGEVYLSEALFPGAQITMFRAASIAGNITPPADWPDLSGEPDPDYGQVLMFDGGFDVTYGHIRNLGDSALNAVTITTNGNTSQGGFSLNYAYMSDMNAGYMMRIVDGGSGPAKTIEFNWFYMSDNLKLYDDGSDGHGFSIFDEDAEDTVILRHCGGRRLTDDFAYIRQGAGMEVYDSWYTESNGNVAFFDGQANEADPTSIIAERNWCIGAGDNVIQLNGATATTAERTYRYADNFWSRPNLKWNRVSTLIPASGGDNTVRSTLPAATVVTNPKTFVSLRDTLQWFLGAGFDVGVVTATDAADTVYFTSGLFRNGGFMQGSVGVTPTSCAAGNGVTSQTTAVSNVIVTSCVFRDNGSRGDLSAFSSRAAYGIGWRSGVGGELRVRRCVFEGDHNTTTKDYDVYIDGAVDLVEITDSVFLSNDQEEGAVSTASTPDLLLLRNVFTGYGTRFVINSASTGDEVFKFNTFHVPPAGKRVFESLNGPTIVGNVFLSRGSSNEFLRFTAEADTLGSVIDWNIYRTGTPNFAIVGATLYNTANWLHGYDANGSVVVSDGTTVDDIVNSEAFPRLVWNRGATSPAHNFITDTSVTNGGRTTDADGTLLDAGATPRMIDR